MKTQNDDLLTDLLYRGTEVFLPSVSVDCVIFGFHSGELKVMLLKSRYNNLWALPGGFVYRKENLEDAARRVLQERTQLKGIYLQQFGVFGDVRRTEQQHLRALLEDNGIQDVDTHWLLQRFVSAGYFALVEFNKVKAAADENFAVCDWHNITELHDLIIDHKQIIEKGLESMRLQLTNQPIGYNLLSKEFPLKDLQLIYEAILGKKLDRPNFQRKILSYGILDRKNKQYTGNMHRPPYLYSFNKENYFKALKEGLHKDW